MDLQGADWFVTAFYANEPRMIDVFKSGKSPHPVTGKLMFGMPEDLITKESKLIGLNNDPIAIEELRKQLPELAQYQNLPRSMSVRQASKKCLVPDTEVLTPDGWKRIDKLSVGDPIAQWDRGTITLVPTKAVWSYKNTEELIHLQSRHLSQVVTANHRIPVEHRKLGSQEYEASKLPKQIDYSVPISGVLHTNTTTPTPAEARFLAAVQADGTVNAYGQIIFKLHKARKLWRLKWLLAELGIDVACKEAGGSIHLPRGDIVTRTVELLCSYTYTRQKRHQTKVARPNKALTKKFGAYLLRFSPEALDAFIDELQYWDGHNRLGGNSFHFFTTVGENASWVQTAAHLTGRRATIRERPQKHGFGKKHLFHVSVGKANNTNTVSIKRSTATSDKVFCATVPSGFFLIRHDGKISVTGNSNHGGNYREAYKTFSLVNEIQEAEGKRWLELYHKAYPGLRERWYPWIDKTVRDTRTLTNCFGRAVYFQGALDDETFRQATAFVPQSTVFDVTGHAMTRIFEDDSPDFEPAELLAQVHDSLLMQYTSRDFRAMARYAIKVGLEYMSPTLCYNNMDFTLDVGLKVGRSWGSMTEIKLTQDPDALALELERVYDKAYS